MALLVIYLIYTTLSFFCKKKKDVRQKEEGLIPYFKALDTVDRLMLNNTYNHFKHYYNTCNYSERQLKELQKSVQSENRSKLIEGVPTYRILDNMFYM